MASNVILPLVESSPNSDNFEGTRFKTECETRFQPCKYFGCKLHMKTFLTSLMCYLSVCST